MDLTNWQKIVITVAVIFTLNFIYNAPAWAANNSGAEIFSANCAGCHAKGGNIVRRGKNLKQRALHRYGVDSIAAVSSLVANGKNAMPAYKDRLSNQEIEAVAAYVLEQADNNWRSN